MMKMSTNLWNQRSETPYLSGNMLHIWKIMLPLDEDLLSRLQSHLSNDEIQRLNNIIVDLDKKKFIAARGILRELIGSYLTIAPHKIQFSQNPYGKPYLAENLLTFNVSHSHDCIIFGFTHDDPLGVDIEYCKVDFDLLSVAQDFCTNNELQKLLSLTEEERSLGFYRCWTRKEAVLKAIGLGLYFPLKALEVSLLSTEAISIINLEEKLSNNTRWNLMEINPAQNYIGAIASTKKFDNIFQWDWNLLRS